ncbi:MAG: DNA-binding protein [Candidatus Competibacteraceae bacterium]|nr:DNA-binding protein [Candidatus Competibacteraceae bacterium]MBK9951514.1 DNA-binding protein [Candidatus Competibacteraceae bacterium]
MARTGITFENVRDAAESLLGRGLNPTIQRVREALGTGSNTTISEHLKIWQQQLAETPKIVLPPSVPEAVALALDAFWKIAVQHAESAFEDQRAIAAQTAAAAEQAREATLNQCREIQSEIDQLRRQLETTQTAARDLADRLLVEQERRANAETAIQAAEARARSAAQTADQLRAETAARVAQLETALQQTRTDLEHQRHQAQQDLETEQRRNEASESRWLGLIDQLRAEQNTERERFASERQEWTRLESAWRAQQENQRAETAELKADLATAQERQTHLAAELQKLQTLRESSEIQHLETVRELEALRGELKAMRADRDRWQPQSPSAAASPALTKTPKSRSAKSTRKSQP